MMFFAFFLVLAGSALTYTINQLEDQQDQNDYSQNKVPKQSSYYKSDNIRQIYETALKVFPGAFAFTKAESEQMPDLLLRSVQSDFSCKKQFSKSTLWKIKELNSILNATHCGGIYISRYRRSEITNNDGSITNTKRCVKRGESMEVDNNFAYLAASCSATTDLSEDRFPRYINEVICDKSEGPACIKGNGAVTQFENTLKFRFDDRRNKLGLGRLSEWKEYDQKIRTGCACNVMKSSRMKDTFV